MKRSFLLRAVSGMLALLSASVILFACAQKPTDTDIASNTDSTPDSSNTHLLLLKQYESLLLLQQQELEALHALQYLQNQNQNSSQNSDSNGQNTRPGNNSDSDVKPPAQTDTESNSAGNTHGTVPDKPPVQNSLRDLLWKQEGEGILITGCQPGCTDLTIPASINGIPVLKIAENAFAGSKLQTVVLEEGIRELGWFAFYECSELVSVTIPQSVTRIGYAAFDGSTKGFRIRCQSGSYAEKFARSFAIPTEEP